MHTTASLLPLCVCVIYHPHMSQPLAPRTLAPSDLWRCVHRGSGPAILCECACRSLPGRLQWGRSGAERHIWDNKSMVWGCAMSVTLLRACIHTEACKKDVVMFCGFLIGLAPLLWSPTDLARKSAKANDSPIHPPAA